MKDLSILFTVDHNLLIKNFVQPTKIVLETLVELLDALINKHDIQENCIYYSIENGSCRVVVYGQRFKIYLNFSNNEIVEIVTPYNIQPRKSTHQEVSFEELYVKLPQLLSLSNVSR